MKVKTCQHGRGRRRPGARRKRHTMQVLIVCRDQGQTLRLHVPKGVTSQRRNSVKEELDKRNRGSHNRVRSEGNVASNSAVS